MSLGIEERRRAVERALGRATDYKLLSGGTHPARAELEDAWELALQSPRLPPPWPQLVAYRLAHVLMRANDDRQLERARALFEEAARDGILGPMPHVYLLATLSRLRSEQPDDARRAELDARLAVVFKKAIELTKNLPYIRSRSSEGSYEDASIQHGIVNLLELSAYYLQQPYVPLEGVGGAYRDLGLGEDWFLVGPDPAIAAIRYPESLAMAELEARGEANPGAVLFCWPMYPEQPMWKAPGDKWRKASEPHIRLVANILKPDTRSRLDFRDKIVGEEDDRDDAARRDARYRQIVSRTEEKLQDLCGRPGADLIQPGVRNEVPVLAPDMVIFGAVSEEALNSALTI